MKCAECKNEMKRLKVSVYGANRKVISYQCGKCGYSEFDDKTAKEVVNELREAPIKIPHKIIKISRDKLGMYFGKHIIRSLGLVAGEKVFVSVPDKKHIVLEI